MNDFRTLVDNILSELKKIDDSIGVDYGFDISVKEKLYKKKKRVILKATEPGTRNLILLNELELLKSKYVFIGDVKQGHFDQWILLLPIEKDCYLRIGIDSDRYKLIQNAKNYVTYENKTTFPVTVSSLLITLGMSTPENYSIDFFNTWDDLPYYPNYKFDDWLSDILLANFMFEEIDHCKYQVEQEEKDRELKLNWIGDKGVLDNVFFQLQKFFAKETDQKMIKRFVDAHFLVNGEAANYSLKHASRWSNKHGHSINELIKDAEKNNTTKPGPGNR